MSEISINQGLAWLSTLKERHSELVGLRNQNSSTRIRRWGETKEDVVEKPTYNVVELDALIGKIALEISRLDDAIKTTNAETTILNYEKDESVLGQLS